MYLVECADTLNQIWIPELTSSKQNLGNFCRMHLRNYRFLIFCYFKTVYKDVTNFYDKFCNEEAPKNIAH